jgi:hypothetical protein
MEEIPRIRMLWAVPADPDSFRIIRPGVRAWSNPATVVTGETS